MKAVLSIALLFSILGAVTPALAISLEDAVRRAVDTNPTIAGAQANHEATQYELEQAYGRLYPEIDLSGEAGPQFVNKPNSLSPAANRQTLTRLQSTLTVRQFLFDGFDRSNDIYRAQSRVSAAALRILERSELLALGAVEAYIDARRHMKLLRLARASADRHREIVSLLQVRRRGGKAPVSDVDQARERLSAAEAIVVDIRLALAQAEAKFERIVGVRSRKLHGVGAPPGLPRSKRRAIEVAMQSNKAVNVAEADITVAEAEKAQSESAFYPTLSLEGNAVFGNNIDGTRGRNDDLNGKLVLRWRLFDGRIRDARTAELRARVAQREAEHQDRIRHTTEAVDRAWSSYRIGRERVRVLRGQVRANFKVVETYLEEYKLSKRSLLDLLNAENANFRGRFELINAQAISLFASYQLLANMGRLLDHFSISPKQYEIGVTDNRRVFGLSSTSGFSIPSLQGK